MMCCGVAEGSRGSEEVGGKRGLGGFLHSFRDVATRVVDDTTKEISKIERTLGQAHFLLLPQKSLGNKGAECPYRSIEESISMFSCRLSCMVCQMLALLTLQRCTCRLVRLESTAQLYKLWVNLLQCGALGISCMPWGIWYY